MTDRGRHGNARQHSAVLRSRILHRKADRGQDRFADAMTRFSGSMAFLYLHAAWFTAWIVLNTLLPRRFDPYPFGLLTLIVSLEAIFLSTFVLISQNRQSEREDKRQQIEFEIDLRSEVWTEVMAEKPGVDRDEVQRRMEQRRRDVEQVTAGH